MSAIATSTSILGFTRQGRIEKKTNEKIAKIKSSIKEQITKNQPNIEELKTALYTESEGLGKDIQDLSTKLDGLSLLKYSIDSLSDGNKSLHTKYAQIDALLGTLHQKIT